MSDGGGTRQDIHGASVTRSAEPISTREPTSATQAAAVAPTGHDVSTTMAKPASWTTATAGIATKLQTRPAMLTRANTAAATGSSTSSAATVAANNPSAALTSNLTAALRTRVPGVHCANRSNRRAAHSTMPSVAPKDSHAPTSITISGSTSTSMSATSDSTFTADGRRPNMLTT